MKKNIILVFVLLLFATGIANAETYRAELNASNTAIYGGLDAKLYVTKGYMKVGGNGLFIDTDAKEFSLFNLKVSVGSETLFPNLFCEVGFKGILGTAEERDDDDSVGAIAFTGLAAYRLPQAISPIPIQFSLELSGSPKPLSFMDADNYFDTKAGIDFYIVDNASLQLSYRYYSIDMDGWEFKDDLLMLGIALEF